MNQRIEYVIMFQTHNSHAHLFQTPIQLSIIWTGLKQSVLVAILRSHSLSVLVKKLSVSVAVMNRFHKIVDRVLVILLVHAVMDLFSHFLEILGRSNQKKKKTHGRRIRSQFYLCTDHGSPTPLSQFYLCTDYGSPTPFYGLPNPGSRIHQQQKKKKKTLQCPLRYLLWDP